VDEVFNDQSVELIIVNTPNETHYSFAIRALEAGKHVVVEKPFSVTTKEADELIALAKKTGKVLTVFQNRRWDGDFLTLKEIIKDKLVGGIVEFELHYDRFRTTSKPIHGKKRLHPARAYFIILARICLTRCWSCLGCLRM
jgi:predicted dehydrogenase